MFDSAARKPATLSTSGTFARHLRGLKLRKIWLPKAIYDALPYFYFISGIAAFLATLYINQWFWVLPHYLLFSAACLHLGVYVFHRRHRKDHDQGDHSD